MESGLGVKVLAREAEVTLYPLDDNANLNRGGYRQGDSENLLRSPSWEIRAGLTSVDEI